MDNKFEMVAKTFQGLEDVLKEELTELGAENIEVGNRMVTFEGDNSMLYRANLCCRTALRILKPIVKFTADDPDDLYDKVRELNWEQFMSEDTTFSIDSTVNGNDFTHSKFVTYRVKDAIADHFYDSCGKRPSIRIQGADLQLNVHISDNRVTISLDSSGEPLFKRGYRVAQVEAPINEVLAAGIILKTGWRGDTDFIDPMCGSGTFLIEAALIAANINPGIYRESFAFEKWKDFDRDLFEEIYNDDSEEREFAHKIYGGDIDADAVAATKKNIKSAKVEDMVEIIHRPFSEWTENAPEGMLVTNPPYGERLKPENIKTLYKTFGTTLKNNFAGWHAWVIGYKDEHFDEIGLKPSVKIPLHNGNLECTLREYVMFNGKYSEFKADGGDVSNHRGNSGGPKKVRHISDDEWEKTSKKFNSGKGFKGNSRDSRSEKKGGKDRFERKPKEFRADFNDGSFSDENDSRDYSRNERRDDFRRRAPQRERRDGNFNRENNRRDFRPDGRKEDYRGENRKRDFRDDRSRDNRDNHGKDFRGDRGRDFRNNERRNDFRGSNGGRGYRGNDDFRRSNREGINYNPDNSKSPKISKDNETVINSVHYRQRKNKDISPED